MAPKIFSLVGLFSLLLLGGCARSATARQNALFLQNQLGIYEQTVDEKIQSQENYYKLQAGEIAKSKRASFPIDLETHRRARSAVFADQLSVDASSNARISNIETYLLQSADDEYAYYIELQKKEQQSALDIQLSISKLQSQRQAIEQVRSALGQLATESKDRTQQILSSAEDLLKTIPTK